MPNNSKINQPGKRRAGGRERPVGRNPGGAGGSHLSLLEADIGQRHFAGPEPPLKRFEIALLHRFEADLQL